MWVEKSTWGLLGTRLEKVTLPWNSTTSLESDGIGSTPTNPVIRDKHSNDTRRYSCLPPSLAVGFSPNPTTLALLIESSSHSRCLARPPSPRTQHPQSRRDGRPEAVLGFWKGCIRPRIAAKRAGADRSTPDGPGLRAVPLARRRRVCPALLTGRAAGCEAANWLLPPPPPPLCAPNSQHHEAGQDQVCIAACRSAWRGECLAGEGGASFSRRWQASGNFESCNLLLCVCAGSRSINVS